MAEYLQTTIDKFTFRVATDRLYTSDGTQQRNAGALIAVHFAVRMGIAASSPATVVHSRTFHRFTTPLVT